MLKGLCAFKTLNFKSVFIILISLLIHNPKITFQAVRASNLLINCFSLTIIASNKSSH